MTAPETRWTAETEEVLAKAFMLVAYQSEGEDTSGIDGDWDAADEENRTWVMAAIRPVLEALADAGLLLPPGGETSEERSWSHSDGTDCADLDCAPNRLAVTRTLTEWPDGTVLTGPWIEVPS